MRCCDDDENENDDDVVGASCILGVLGITACDRYATTVAAIATYSQHELAQ
jgi:hypothetical protein